MTTTLTDKQLYDAYNIAWCDEWDRLDAEGTTRKGDMEVKRHGAGLRAVADLAITHIEAELHSVNQELEALKKSR